MGISPHDLMRPLVLKVEIGEITVDEAVGVAFIMGQTAQDHIRNGVPRALVLEIGLMQHDKLIAVYREEAAAAARIHGG